MRLFKPTEQLGRIRPGQFVSQRELMELLEMPLAAVRELVPRLEAAGLIKTVPKRGLQIASVDMKLIRNAWQVRAMVEREAVINFARVASPETLARLIESHEAILERALQPQPDATLERDAQAVDWGLHDLMVDTIGNEILSEIYRVNSLHVRSALKVRPLDLDAESIHELIILQWLPVSRFINAMDRSLGAHDSYPFVDVPPVIEKLDFIHRVARAGSAGRMPMNFLPRC